MRLFVCISFLLAATAAVPQRNGPLPREEAEAALESAPDGAGFVPVRYIEHCTTREAIAVDIDSIDARGCLIGPCGESVCPNLANVANDTPDFIPTPKRKPVVVRRRRPVVRRKPVAHAPATHPPPLTADEPVEEVAPAVSGHNAVRTIKHCTTGEIIPVDVASIDPNGCLVGPCGDRVCPQGSIGVGNDSNTFRGNKGPKNTGSNGNASPLGADGRPVDPAAVTYLKQIAAYEKWALQQAENNKKIIG